MGSCLHRVSTPEKVLNGNKPGVVFLPKKKSMCRAKIIVETPGNLLANDSSETSDNGTQSYSNSFTIFREFSFSDPLIKKIEKERFYEECFEMSHTTNLPHQISSTNLKTARPETSQTSLRLLPSVSLSTRFLPEHSSSELHLNNIISSKADYFEEFDSNNFSNVTGLQTDDTMLSENDVMMLQDIITSTSTTVFTETRGISVEPGMVLAMCLTKDGHRFKQLNINMTLDDVVASFLSTDNKTKLPLSITESKKPRIMGRNQMLLTIAENLGPHFDVKTQGLVFATGIVNSRLCHKVCIGDLHQMQKIFSHEA